MNIRVLWENNITFDTIARFLFILVIGIIYILAGIFKWKFPTVWRWRETELGELLNTVLSVIFGICMVWGSFVFLVDNM